MGPEVISPLHPNAQAVTSDAVWGVFRWSHFLLLALWLLSGRQAGMQAGLGEHM